MYFTRIPKNDQSPPVPWSEHDQISYTKGPPLSSPHLYRGIILEASKTRHIFHKFSNMNTHEKCQLETSLGNHAIFKEVNRPPRKPIHDG